MLWCQIHLVGIKFDAAFGTEILRQQLHHTPEILDTAVFHSECRNGLFRLIGSHNLANTIHHRAEYMADNQIRERRFLTIGELFVEAVECRFQTLDVRLLYRESHSAFERRQDGSEQLEVELPFDDEIAVECQNIEFAIVAFVKLEYAGRRHEHRIFCQFVFRHIG